jgi:uncharacterized protein YuzE
MKYKYDPQTDTLLIILSAEKPDFAEQQGDLITHYNKDQKPVEIEILNARQATLDMLQAMIPDRRKTAKAHN